MMSIPADAFNGIPMHRRLLTNMCDSALFCFNQLDRSRIYLQLNKVACDTGKNVFSTVKMIWYFHYQYMYISYLCNGLRMNGITNITVSALVYRCTMHVCIIIVLSVFKYQRNNFRLKLYWLLLNQSDWKALGS